MSNRTTCSPIQIESRPMPSARWPKSRIICRVALGDMNVEKTPILMPVLLLSVGLYRTTSFYHAGGVVRSPADLPVEPPVASS